MTDQHTNEPALAEWLADVVHRYSIKSVEDFTSNKIEPNCPAAKTLTEEIRGLPCVSSVRHETVNCCLTAHKIHLKFRSKAWGGGISLSRLAPVATFTLNPPEFYQKLELDWFKNDRPRWDQYFESVKRTKDQTPPAKIKTAHDNICELVRHAGWTPVESKALDKHPDGDSVFPKDFAKYSYAFFFFHSVSHEWEGPTTQHKTSSRRTTRR